MLIHLLSVLRAALRRPRNAALGVREFRLGATTFFDPPQIDAYDAGRELAHLATLRRFETV